MARKLPWTLPASTSNAATSSRSSATNRPAKRVKTEPKEQNTTNKRDILSSSPVPSNRESTASTPARKNASTRAQDRSRNGRSPSTSPPPAPPPVELMRPGLDEDDIYMLVEDEFQAVAQSYTAHLHHAEYKRLMKLAKERKAEQRRAGGGELMNNDIPDDVTPETRQRLKRDLLAKRQSSGVKSMLNGGGTANDGAEEDEDSDNDEAREAVLAREEKKVGDMWIGTALGGLMSWDHSQEKTSLKGLDRIGGETRASKGFGPSMRVDRAPSGEIHNDERIAEPQQIESGRPVRSTKRADETEKRDQSKQAGHTPRDEDNYFKPSQKQPAEKQSSSTRPTAATRNDPATSKIKIKSEFPKAPTAGRTKYRSLIDSLDDFDDAAFDASQAKSKSISPEKPSRVQMSIKSKERQKKDRKDRLDEVPVFLI